MDKLAIYIYVSVLYKDCIASDGYYPFYHVFLIVVHVKHHKIASADSITDNGTTPEGLTAHIESEDIEITISGPAGKLELVDGVNAYVDLSGYEAGTYENVPVIIELPDDVLLTSETAGVTVVLS